MGMFCYEELFTNVTREITVDDCKFEYVGTDGTYTNFIYRLVLPNDSKSVILKQGESGRIPNYGYPYYSIVQLGEHEPFVELCKFEEEYIPPIPEPEPDKGKCTQRLKILSANFNTPIQGVTIDLFQSGVKIGSQVTGGDGINQGWIIDVGKAYTFKLTKSGYKETGARGFIACPTTFKDYWEVYMEKIPEPIPPTPPEPEPPTPPTPTDKCPRGSIYTRGLFQECDVGYYQGDLPGAGLFGKGAACICAEGYIPPHENGDDGTTPGNIMTYVIIGAIALIALMSLKK